LIWDRDILYAAGEVGLAIEAGCRADLNLDDLLDLTDITALVQSFFSGCP
jgi:hypothetical protein